ncbi:hypothetical protein E2562_020234 [Oryza meyeriana var. granulata]|uniref:Uncharacterized protein n=1 Tax=Oryza meyeriana var. granulata TaxID=110450 RepID=A0A6G1DKZ5_9ORYZ|nr:hypothetical protein E2562_020234 [Oryza meyeriana var. granulata]
MATVEGEVGDLTKKVVDLTTSLNNIESVKGMEHWIPSVDAGIQGLNQAMEGIAAWVTILETKPPASPSMVAPTPDGHRHEELHQGDASRVLAAPE